MADVAGTTHDSDAEAAEADPMTALGDAIAEIVQQGASGEFPEVRPSQMPSEDQEWATYLHTWVQKTEHVSLESYIQERYGAYRKTLPESVSEPEAVVRAKWMRDSFYWQVAEYRKQAETSASVMLDAYTRCSLGKSYPRSNRTG